MILDSALTTPAKETFRLSPAHLEEIREIVRIIAEYYDCGSNQGYWGALR